MSRPDVSTASGKNRSQPWDIAAGILLIREAGGFVSDKSGGQNMFDTRGLVAGNEAIHKALLKTLKRPVSAR